MISSFITIGYKKNRNICCDYAELKEYESVVILILIDIFPKQKNIFYVFFFS